MPACNGGHSAHMNSFDDTMLPRMMQELCLRLKHTFGTQLFYVGTTTTAASQSDDVDVLIVLNQMSDAHIRHTWNIISWMRNRWNIYLDCRIRSVKDTAKQTLLESHLLGHFLVDCFGNNPFRDARTVTDALARECRRRIEHEEQNILGMLSRLVNDRSRLAEVARSVYDALRAFLVLVKKPCRTKDATKTICEISPSFAAIESIYEGYTNPTAVVDIPRFLADALAFVKHLSYRAQLPSLIDEVLLINTPSAVMPHPLDDQFGYDANMPLGLVCVASYLAEQSIPVRILDAYANNLSASGTVDEIVQDNRIPRIIGLSSASTNIDVVYQIAEYLKRVHDDVVIVCGGPHATLDTADTLSCRFIDYVVKGEGENAMADFAEAWLRNNREAAEAVPGIFKPGEDGQVSGTANEVPFPLDKLPLPRFDLLPLGDRYFHRKRRLYLHTTRGCKFRCAYCSVQKIWGGVVRRVPLALLFEHLDCLLDRYKPVEEIQIVDDNFSHCYRDEQGNKAQVVEAFCRELARRKMDIRWKCQARPDQLNAELIALMQQTGCFEVDLGVESGDEGIQRLIRKGLDLANTADVVEALHGAGIHSKAFFILGFPGETWAQLATTINYAITLHTHGLADVAFFPAMPFPGTELAEWAERDTGRKPRRGGVMDESGRRYRSFAGQRLRKHSAMPEYAMNELLPPDRLRFLIHFAYERFEERQPVTDLREEFAQFEANEEAAIYGE